MCVCVWWRRGCTLWEKVILGGENCKSLWDYFSVGSDTSKRKEKMYYCYYFYDWDFLLSFERQEPTICVYSCVDFFFYALSIIYSFKPHKVTTDQPEGLQSSVATFVIWVMVSEEVIQQEAGKRLHHQLVIRLVEDKTVGAIQQTDPFCKKKKKKQQCLTASAFKCCLFSSPRLPSFSAQAATFMSSQ